MKTILCDSLLETVQHTSASTIHCNSQYNTLQQPVQYTAINAPYGLLAWSYPRTAVRCLSLCSLGSFRQGVPQCLIWVCYSTLHGYCSVLFPTHRKICPWHCLYGVITRSVSSHSDILQTPCGFGSACIQCCNMFQSSC